ncbi:MAG TPA: Gfo/Idh/MocA family oxidoreductase [Pseudorhodoplanes sp.]|jgi:predicted dehydrogenase|nr:Gfo/Idh/MocA family oxidoreductase [Pseudorhodoplanes sp.]
MNKVRWGILGVAKIALNRVIPAMKSSSNSAVVAIASRDLARAREAAAKAGIERAYGSYEELLADPTIEAIYNPLPNHMHVEWSIKAMEAGKHVLCEKPISLTAAEAEKLVGARERTGRLIEEAFAIRNHPQWAALREVIDSGEIGAVRGVQTMLCMNSRDPNDIRNKADIGGGALYDLGSYAITGCRMTFNAEPVRAIGVFDIDPEFKTDRLTSAILEFPNGQATFIVSMQAGPTTGGTHQHLGVIAERGWIRGDFPYSHAITSDCHLYIGDTQSIGFHHKRVLTFPPVNQYQLQAERFSRLVRGETASQFPIETAIANMRVIDALRRSRDSRAWETV